ncbi:HNH endonuclease [Sandarakinorhabdus sp.]|uniref:HNH endonuclease n=1 Tax=Sandarakinorhabdus sp. TaxID=1916663 RepID=UPI00286E3AC6|nr:HNH endonuclease [Sandarakinorhabdus sp.]
MIGPMVKRADDVTGLHPSQKAVLHRLCLDADDRGGDTSRLSISDLCRLTGFSWRGVATARTKLAKLGLILVCAAPGERPDTIVDPKPLQHKPVADRVTRSKYKLSATKRKRIMERDAYRCCKCGSHLDLSIDHIVPRSAGGSNEDDNLQTLCVPCNVKKGAAV